MSTKTYSQREAAREERSHGKKIRTVVVEPVPGQEVKVNLRIDVDRTIFWADYEGTWYQAKTAQEAIDKVKEAAKTAGQTTYQRYIEIDSITPSHYSGRSDAVRLAFDYSVVELSDRVFERDGKWNKEQYRLTREVTLDVEGSVIKEAATGRESVHAAEHRRTIRIPWTLQRWQTIRQIEVSLTIVRDKLGALLEGDDAPTQLDALRVANRNLPVLEAMVTMPELAPAAGAKKRKGA